MYFNSAIYYFIYNFLCIEIYMYTNYKIIIISLALSFIWILIYTYIKITQNCNVWYDGLNGIRLENNQKYDKYKIVHPKRC